MRIELKCKCGATAVFEDFTFISPGGHADETGKRFLVEIRAEEWLERHKGCLVDLQEDRRGMG